MNGRTRRREPTQQVHLAGTRAFFGVRAATWDDRFPDDGPAFAAAIQALAPPAGGIALDLGCGTGRALPYLRTAVGPRGTVIGLDLTPEMLVEAGRRGRPSVASLVLGDASHLPLPDCSSDVVLAAGLLTHLPDSDVGLAEFARVTRLGGRLAIFHPIGRAALADRHGHELRPDDIRAEPAIRSHLAGAGWRLDLVDDGPDRYLVVATRVQDGAKV